MGNKQRNRICNNNNSTIIQVETGSTTSPTEITVSETPIPDSKNASATDWTIWDRLYDSRKLEIETQWQRSIFLSAFIILLLTGTGIFYYHFLLDNPNYTLKYCMTSVLLGSLLMISGTLWLAMTKGSKYWTEVYEKKIDILEKELPIDAQFQYKMEYNSNTDKLLVNTNSIKPLKPDHTSPSSVNCFIGVIILLIGIAMILLPVFVCNSEWLATFKSLYTNHMICVHLIFLAVAALLCIIIYIMLIHKCKKAS